MIVSGDGGFASLAKKLHEYGRTVIGAAYRNATNQTLRAVCDDFGWIEAPDEEEPPAKDLKPAKPKPIPANGGTSANTIEDSLATVGKVSMTAGRDEVLATVRKVIQHLAKAPSLKPLLETDGIPLAVIGHAIRLRVENLDYPALGFPKLTGLLCHACTGTTFQIARRLNGDNMVHLIRRNRMPTSEGWEAQPDAQELLSVESEAIFMLRNTVATPGGYQLRTGPDDKTLVKAYPEPRKLLYRFALGGIRDAQQVSPVHIQRVLEITEDGFLVITAAPTRSVAVIGRDGSMRKIAPFDPGWVAVATTHLLSPDRNYLALGILTLEQDRNPNPVSDVRPRW